MARTNIQYVPAEDRKLWCSPLHVASKHSRPKGKENIPNEHETKGKKGAKYQALHTIMKLIK
jgi:hypothetical protein